MENFRKLTGHEIQILESNNCTCKSWGEIHVANDFSPVNISSSNFSGSVSLGQLTKTIQLPSGRLLQAGIHNAYIHNCVIGNNVFISNVRFLSTYWICDNCILENISEIYCHSKSLFGQGENINVINESGGQGLILFSGLTSQLTFLLTKLKYNSTLYNSIIDSIQLKIQEEIKDLGAIYENTVIQNTGRVVDVAIGPYTCIGGATELKNGTIRSTKESPVKIGSGCIVNNFVCKPGAVIDNQSIVQNSFIGENCVISNQFSAEDSAFFANSEMLHGEACSILAGPYTVSHHKSTLLIAGIFSFYNAGSGTNQSNHLYKLGPVHQGSLARGSKTGSGSYIMWPAISGPFTSIIGQHYTHFDTSDFPFSYILKEDNASVLLPAINLKNVGLFRDSEKWPARDKRDVHNRSDLIIYDIFNPFCINKALDGIEILQRFIEKGGESEYVIYQNIKIRRALLKKSMQIYNQAIIIACGDSIIEKIFSGDFNNSKNLNSTGLKIWEDMYGLLVPECLFNEIKKIAVNSHPELLNRLNQLFLDAYENYSSYKFLWSKQLLKDYFKLDIEIWTETERDDFILQWYIAKKSLYNFWIADAKKDYNSIAKLAFGNAFEEDSKIKDFEAVRGIIETDKTILALQQKLIDHENKYMYLTEKRTHT